ncbi:1-phosphofructokinase [Candidatus Arthromitus sp. SFB-rat-Yit]|uniref:1-phosphofructokinase n=1 Tax=Candidatus Arthromitus sp. SFB-rat-Yit TaxID=1041504 RepID=UPI000227A6D6|nr:1-phosphofructokinase [Candidatus Arthromitus sp. SFB-rat-Yit]BAK81109.1 putative 1-phosphofructokinase [Candidatus Arthromitus sp. SFB-rat-Yit]
MIYTFTLNPSIDYIIKLDKLNENCVNIVNSNDVCVGGKGINVSKILSEFEIKSKALGFISGFTGKFVEESLKSNNITSDFVSVENNFSRINIKMKIGESETEINGLGPRISDPHVQLLNNKIDAINDGDIVILSGSIPSSLSDNFYQDILDRLKSKNIKVIVDARKNLLLNSLKYKPFLIKPNNHEVAEIFNLSDPSMENLIECGKKLKKMGATNVLISLGKDGAILINEFDEIYSSNIPNGVLKNSVGAGDSMVAGFIAGYLKTNDYAQALRLGAASGSATAFSENLAKISLINLLINQIQITKL